MARGVNKAIIIGNLGNDPEVRYMPSGSAVANVSVATTDSWRDKQSGEQVERTEWHRVVFFSRLAEIAGEYLRKGSKVYVEGRLQTRKYQDRDGVERYTTEIVANDMQMLDSRGAGSSTSAGFGPSSEAPAGAPRSGGGASEAARTSAAPGAVAPPAAGGTDGEQLDDDIPF